MTFRCPEALAWTDAGDGLFVMRCDIDDVPVYFDGSAAAVLSAADGAADEVAVVAAVAAEHDVPMSRLAAEVTEFLRILVERGYLIRD